MQPNEKEKQNSNSTTFFFFKLREASTNIRATNCIILDLYSHTVNKNIKYLHSKNKIEDSMHQIICIAIYLTID